MFKRFIVNNSGFLLKRIQFIDSQIGIKTYSPCLSSIKLTKKAKEKVKFYIHNDLPDKELENQLKSLKDSIRSQSEAVKALKEAKASNDDIKKAVDDLLSKQSEFTEKIKDFLIEPEKAKETKFDRDSFESLLAGRFFYEGSFEIYGGSSGLYDLGPLGCSIQNNLINEWRKHFVLHDKMLEVDCSILTPEVVLKASGHVGKFCDVMVRDSVDNEAYRVDHFLKSEIHNRIIEQVKQKKSCDELNKILADVEKFNFKTLSEIDDLILRLNVKSPKGNPLTKAEEFSLMFKTEVGPTGKNTSYMRPETAQGIFVNFKRLRDFNKQKLPMIVAQIGKSFRNEINPKSGLIRQREFLMAEIEHFLNPSLKHSAYDRFKLVENVEVDLFSRENQLTTNVPSKLKLREAIDKKLIKSETLAYYIGRIYLFVKNCGVDPGKLRFREHLSNEMAHYANECWDLECLTSYGWIECAGIADRCDYDLKKHTEHSGHELLINESNTIPHVIEPSFGIGRIMYTILEHNFKSRPNDAKKFYFSLPPKVAPYKCNILPIIESDSSFKPIMEKISEILANHEISHIIDDNKGSLGRRYWRSDECGISYAITLDYETLKDETVTIRNRDTTHQIRIKITDVALVIESLIKGNKTWDDYFKKT